MSLIPFPNVPDVPGVPSIPRNGTNLIGFVARVANTAAGVLLFFKTLNQIRIGMYVKETGQMVPSTDGSTIEFTISADNVVPTYPVEDGKWMNYNVVIMPAKISAKIIYAPTLGSTGFSNPKQLQAHLVGTLNALRHAPFPVLWYDGNSFLGDFQLTKFSTSIDNKFGPTAIIINVELIKILTVKSNISTQSITANPRNPYNTPVSDGGLVQPVSKNPTQITKLTGGG